MVKNGPRIMKFGMNREREEERERMRERKRERKREREREFWTQSSRQRKA